jgi:hypothetical protein
VITLSSRAALAFACLASLPSCSHTHLRTNAPGHVDVATPPKEIERREVELPRDPGEHRLALSYGVLLGTASALREHAGDSTGGAASLELSVHYAQAKRSHYDDDLLWPAFPYGGFGINLGYEPLSPYVSLDEAALKRFYVEAQYTHALWAAAGWRADFDRGRHGPQATLGAGPLYVRAVHLFDMGSQFEIGIVIKGYHAWVWSR